MSDTSLTPSHDPVSPASSYVSYPFPLLLATACVLGFGLGLQAEAHAKTKAKKPIAEAKQPQMSSNPEVQQFIEGMQERHGFDAAALTLLFDNQRPDAPGCAGYGAGARSVNAQLDCLS